MEEPRNYQFVSLNGSENGNGHGNGNGYQVYSLPVINQNNHVEEDEESIDLRQLWSVVKHRLRLIVKVALGVTAVSGLWILTQPPKYRGGFQVLVGEPTKKENQVNQLFQGLRGTDIDYETQIEVLRSPSVLEPIIQQLSQKYPEIEYTDLIRYKKSPLKIAQLRDTKILKVSYDDTDREKIQFVLQTLADAYLRYSLEARQTKIKQALEYVDNQLPSLRAKVDILQAQLQQFREQHDLLDPQHRAEQLSDKLLELEENYFDTQVKLNENRTLYGLLQGQLGLDPSQAMASSYLSESPRYQKLLNQLQAIEIELAQQSTIWQEDTPIIQALQDKKQKLLPLLSQEARVVLGNNSPLMLSNSGSLASPSSLRLELNQQFILSANQIEVLEIRRSALAQAIQSFNQQIEQMPSIAREYTNLQQKLSVATASLKNFLAAREKLQLDAAQQALTWQLLAKPEMPENPFFPSPPLHLSLGLVAGLLLGLGAALLAERLDPVFHSTEELKESIPLPILGLIPVQKELDSIEQVTEGGLPQLQIGNTKISFQTSFSAQPNRYSRYQSSSFLEAFRSLNTNIRLLGSDSPIRSLVISSSAPAEGKSTISLNLAQAAAAMGQRVLLVDADLRRPQVHHRLGLENTQGLSNVIATGLDVEQAIQKVPRWDNLSVLSAGDIPPDPNRLLSSQHMQQIMKQLEEQGNFDLVIYDTPPMLGFADARILAASTTGMILVVKMSQTDRSAIKRCIDVLKMSRVSILGVVANNVSPRGNGSHYDYDRYYRSQTAVEK